MYRVGYAISAKVACTINVLRDDSRKNDESSMIDESEGTGDVRRNAKDRREKDDDC